MPKRMRTMLAGLGSLALLVVAVHGQVVPGATYKGSKMCQMCHKNKQGALIAAYVKTPHANAMHEATDDCVVADFANAPFPRAQVAYTLGSGRNQQAYLDKDLKVLPAKWLVAEKKWEPTEAVDGATECVGCHVTNFDAETKKWTELGVGCESCHGPGSKHQTAPAAARNETIVRPKTLTPPQQMMNCGRCHSRGRDVTGKHAFPVGYLPGEDLTAKFKDAEPKTPGMNQQYSDLRQSPKHFANGVTCEKCHDPHGDTANPHQLILPVNETCQQCHKDKTLPEHAVAKGHTAAPGATCATCHMPEGRHLFDATQVAK